MSNEEMRESWNGDRGEEWAQGRDRYDDMLEPFVAPLLAAARLEPAMSVVDVGCGSGALSRAAADQVGPDGRVTGLDISAPLLDLARTLGGQAAMDYVQCDVQTDDLSDLGADVAVSRFGVMFFDDPRSAFANIGRALEPGGRLAYCCWRGPLENPFFELPMNALVEVVGRPEEPGPGAPGRFQMADPEFVRSILTDSGWVEVGIEPFDCMVRLGGAYEVHDAVEFFTGDGVGKRMLADKPAELHKLAHEALTEALQPHVGPDGVMLGAAAWLVTATRRRIGRRLRSTDVRLSGTLRH